MSFLQYLLPTGQKLRVHVLENGEDPDKVRICCWCHKAGEKLQRCAACGAFYYCGLRCQEKHWRSGHKKECKRVPRSQFPKYTGNMQIK